MHVTRAQVQHAIWISAILLVVLATHWRWFYQPLSILTYGDWWHYNREQMSEQLAWPTILTNENFGGINMGISMYPVSLAFGVLSKYMPFGLIERIIFFWPSIIVCSLGSYYLGWKITKRHDAAFIQSMVLTYNVYFVLLRTGHLTLTSSFAFAPVILGLLISLLKTPNVKYALLLSLAYLIAGTYEIRALYLTTIVVILMTCATFLTRLKSPKHIAKCAVYLLLSTLIVGVFNFYWIVAFSNVDYLSSGNPLFQRVLFGSQFMSLYRSLALFHPFWSGGQQVPFVVYSAPIFFFLIPALAVIPFTKAGNKRFYYVIFGIIAVLGIFLTKMSHPPFKDTYEWLYLNFPGFGAFRESSKFYFFIALGYSGMIAINYASFSTWIGQYKSGLLFKRLIFLMIALLFLFNTKPLIDGSIGSIFIPQQIPQEYVQLNALLKNDGGMHRILTIPYNSRWVSITQKRPYVGYNDMLEFANNYVEGLNLKASTLSESVDSNLNNPQLLQFMAEWSVRYIVVPISHEGSGEGAFAEKDELMKSLTQNKHFRPTIITDRRGQLLGLFELIDPAPRQTQKLGDTDAIYERNRVILSTRYSKNWVLSYENKKVAGAADQFGRVVFNNVPDNAKISLSFAPQEKLDVNFKWSVWSVIFLICTLVAICIMDIYKLFYGRFTRRHEVPQSSLSDRIKTI
ncbi:MAG: hypothetical protein WCO78_04475 [Candidatus Roizmanbacteria bacterium]